MRNEIQEAVYQGILDEFASDSDCELHIDDNNPMSMMVNGHYRCQIRVNTANCTIEVWTPVKSELFDKLNVPGSAGVHCHPHTFIPLESPTCFEDLFSLLRELKRPVDL